MGQMKSGSLDLTLPLFIRPVIQGRFNHPKEKSCCVHKEEKYNCFYLLLEFIFFSAYVSIVSGIVGTYCFADFIQVLVKPVDVRRSAETITHDPLHLMSP